MAKQWSLQAQTPLQGYSAHIGDTLVRENSQLAILGFSFATEQRSDLEAALSDAIGLGIPQVGKVNRHASGLALLGLQPGHCLLVDPQASEDFLSRWTQTLDERAYLTDQSDSWAVLELSGPQVNVALERLSTIDLNATIFGLNTVARTSMEHLSVIIEKPDDSLFRLYSPRSSAGGFLHAITQSIQYTSSTTAE